MMFTNQGFSSTWYILNVCFFPKVYGTELEKVEVFNGFQDFVETFYIHRGKVKSKSEEEETIVGEFKASEVRMLESILNEWCYNL